MKGTTGSEASSTSTESKSPGMDNPADDFWGNIPSEAVTEILRVVSLNINGLPLRPDSDKYSSVYDYMHDYDIDVLALQETNVQWHLVPPEQRLNERTRGWFQRQYVKAAWFSKYESEATHVYGGTAIIVRGNAAGRVIRSGHDRSGLGRWSWLELRGYDGKSVIVVSAYRPVYNPFRTGSVWSQHKTYFDSQRPPILGDPRDLFLQDLVAELQPLHDAGSQIIICMDSNETSLKQENNIIEAKLKVLGLVDVVLSNHRQAQAPPTTNGFTDLTQAGPVDTIMAPSAICSECECGYLPFQALSNHRGVYSDFNEIQLFGLPARQSFVAPSGRRLQCKDPCTVRRYNKVMKAELFVKR